MVFLDYKELNKGRLNFPMTLSVQDRTSVESSVLDTLLPLFF